MKEVKTYELTEDDLSLAVFMWAQKKRIVPKDTANGSMNITIRQRNGERPKIILSFKVEV